jgi:hypothetical protein
MDALERAKKELKDLNDKIQKLSVFLQTPQYLVLIPAQQQLLRAQLRSMQSYAEILDMRIKLWNN